MLVHYTSCGLGEDPCPLLCDTNGDAFLAQKLLAGGCVVQTQAHVGAAQYERKISNSQCVVCWHLLVARLAAA